MLFGEGDICISPGRYIDNDTKVGFILFCNQEPRPIGSPGDVKAGTVVDVNDFPVVMKFRKIESIDVITILISSYHQLLQKQINLFVVQILIGKTIKMV